MFSIIVIVEDKKFEQDAAIEAIKNSLGSATEIARLEVLGQVSYKTGDKDGTMIQIASDLGRALDKIKLVEEIAGHDRDGSMRVGVITDLMFPRDGNGTKEEPNGLTVIAECIKLKLPVVVCSDTDHHDINWLKPIFPILEQAHPAGRIPRIFDKKDWRRAVELLNEMTAQ